MFNSRYNLETFLEGVDNFLHIMPDFKPKSLFNRLKEKSSVVSVPITMKPHLEKKHDTLETPCILWNHRWEYDKGPEKFLVFLRKLVEKIDFKLILLGKRFRQVPESFNVLRNEFADKIIVDKFAESDEYLHYLDKSDFVVSTSLHDFQGLSILEAVSRGCLPLLPKRVVYPEYFAEDWLYQTSEDYDKEAVFAAEKLTWLIKHHDLDNLKPTIAKFAPEVVMPQFEDMVTNLIGLRR